MSEPLPPVETAFGRWLKAKRNPVGVPEKVCGFMWRKHEPHLNDEEPPHTTWCPGNPKDKT